MEFDVLSQYANGLVRRIVRSALTPALWLCFFAPVCWGTAYFFSFRPALEALLHSARTPVGFAPLLPAT